MASPEEYQEKVPDMARSTGRDQGELLGKKLLHPGNGRSQGTLRKLVLIQAGPDASGIVFGHLGISGASEKSCGPEQWVLVGLP